jgi:hypothetical protein
VLFSGTRLARELGWTDKWFLRPRGNARSLRKPKAPWTSCGERREAAAAVWNRKLRGSNGRRLFVLKFVYASRPFSRFLLQAAAFAPKRLATRNKGSRWLNRLTFSLHRGDLQQSQASFGTRLSEPATV